MFEIDEQPVEAAGLHHLGDVDGARLAHADAERQLAAPEPLAGRIANLHVTDPLPIAWIEQITDPPRRSTLRDGLVWQ